MKTKFFLVIFLLYFFACGKDKEEKQDATSPPKYGEELFFEGELDAGEYFEMAVSENWNQFSEMNTSDLLTDHCTNESKRCFKINKGGHSFLEVCFNGQLHEVCPMRGTTPDKYPDAEPTGSILHGQRCFLGWSPCRHD